MPPIFCKDTGRQQYNESKLVQKYDIVNGLDDEVILIKLIFYFIFLV